MKIGYVTCPAFGNEKIYFTQAGFNHLLRKGRIPRKHNEQIRRLTLVYHAPTLLAVSTTASSYERTYLRDSSADFWSFVGTRKEISITIVIRQLNGGQKHFFSIF
jgi:hypothetical protein